MNDRPWLRSIISPSLLPSLSHRGETRRNRLKFRRDTKKGIHKTSGQFISIYSLLFFQNSGPYFTTIIRPIQYGIPLLAMISCERVRHKLTLSRVQWGYSSAHSKWTSSLVHWLWLLYFVQLESNFPLYIHPLCQSVTISDKTDSVKWCWVILSSSVLLWITLPWLVHTLNNCCSGNYWRLAARAHVRHGTMPPAEQKPAYRRSVVKKQTATGSPGF